MTTLLAGLNVIPPIRQVFWTATDATSSAGGVATFTFGSAKGRRVYFLKITPTTAAPTLKTGFARPQYDGPTFIPKGQPQAIPVALEASADPTVVLIDIDPTQALQFYVTNLDGTVAYTAAIGTDLLDESCR